MVIDYRMGNPMESLLATAGGLQQLQARRQQMQGEQQRQDAFAQQQQAQQQQAAANQQRQARVQELVPMIQGGDYDAAIELASISPEISSAVNQARANMSEGQDRVTAEWIAGYQAAPDKDAYLAQENQTIQIDDQFRNAAPEQRDIMARIVGAQLMPKEMYQAAFQQQAGPSEYSNIAFDQQGVPFGINKATGQYEQVPGGFVRGEQKPSTVVNVGAGQGEQDKVISKAEGEIYNTIQKAGFNTRKQDATLNRLEKLSDKAFDGVTAGAYRGAAKLAEAVGIDVEGLTETELFTALSNDLVLGQTSQLTGVLTDRDMAFLENTVPQLSQTKEGRKQLIGIMKEVNKASREKAQLAKDFRKEKGYFDAAEFDEFLAGREVKDRFAPQDGGTGAPKVGTVMQGYKFLGGDPSNPSSWEKQ